MKKTTLLLAFAFTCLSGCAHYTFNLVKPIESKELVYENDTMNLKLVLMPTSVSQINFTLKNKLNTPMKIIWDDMSWSLNNKTSRIMHKGTKYYDRNNVQPNTNIPANGYISEVIAPTDYVILKCGKGNRCEWDNLRFFPRSKHAGRRALGSTMLMLLTYQINGVTFNKDIEMKVTAVK